MEDCIPDLLSEGISEAEFGGELYSLRVREGHQRVVPSEIYTIIMNVPGTRFLQNFMGYRERQVRFLGHNIRLQVDETPVIAKGFDRLIQEGVVFALESKKGVPEVRMVSIENMFLVTPAGGECLTGGSLGLIPVY